MPIYRVPIRLTFAAGGGRGQNTWTIRTAGVGGEEDDAIDVLTDVIRGFYAGIAAVLPASYRASFDGQVSEDLTAEPAYLPPRAAWSVAGTGGGTYGPAAGMACVTWRTSLATRSGRGRTFVGPLSATAVEADGSLTPTALNLLRTTAAAVVNYSSGTDNVGAVSVLSQVQGIARDVVGASVTDQVAILRSRRD